MVIMGAERVEGERFELTEAMFVVYKLPFEQEVGVIESGWGGENYMLTGRRMRLFVVGKTQDNQLAAIPFQNRRGEFDHLLVAEYDDPRTLEAALMADPAFNGKIKGPYERSSIRIIELEQDDYRMKVPALVLMKWWQLLRTPGRDRWNLEHQLWLREQVAEAVNQRYEIYLQKLESEQIGDDGIGW